MDLTVTALDSFGNIADGYRGRVSLTASDVQATVPAVYTFTAADAGTHTFSNGLTFRTAGSQTVTATDTLQPTTTGTTSVVVGPAAAAQMRIVMSDPVTAGSPGFVTVTVLDAFANTATGYRGRIQISSSDPLASLPPSRGVVEADNGTVLIAPVVLFTLGPQTVTATDTANPSITGSTGVTVVAPEPAVRLQVFTVDFSPRSGISTTLGVIARDAAGNGTIGYRGTVHFTSSDPSAILPPDYTFTAADQGGHFFTGGVTLFTVGAQTVTGTDTLNPSITGTASLSVAP